MGYVKYARVVLAHKWFVFVAGWYTGAPLWRLLVHDLSKFRPSEFGPYARRFMGARERTPMEYATAWLMHTNRNPHHWEYWVPRTRRGPRNGGTVPKAYPMPEWAVRELVADWYGASRAYEGVWPTLEEWPWMERHFDTLKERLDTETFVMAMALVSRVSDWSWRWPGVCVSVVSVPYGVSVQRGHAPDGRRVWLLHWRTANVHKVLRWIPASWRLQWLTPAVR
jgi:hypothetical protein